MIGWALRQAAIWIFLGLVFYAVVANLPTMQQTAPAPAGAPRPAAAATSSRNGSPNALVFHADRQGHVFVDAFVNGSPVRFLVDTGATEVSLTLHDATAAGFGSYELNFSGRTVTANGTARAAPVQLREIRIGQLSMDNVQALVGENLPFSLLGQSFLRRLDGYEMRNGVLTLTYW